MKYHRLLQNEPVHEIDLEMRDSSDVELNVSRPVYEQRALLKLTSYRRKSFSMRAFLVKQCAPWSCPKVLYNTVPTARWIPEYSWRASFLSDVIAGITVGVITLPQAMAYAMLGNTPPVVGLYMAVFPVVAYFLFSTSRHNSMGTFAIVCLMSGKIVENYARPETSAADFDGNNTLAEGGRWYPSTDVAATVAFTVSMFQMAMYLLRLGMFANVLSEVMVNGFTAGAACHVLCSQLPFLLGLNTKRHRGYFSIPKNIVHLLVDLPQSNRSTITMSLVAVLVMTLNNEVVKPWMSKYTKIPVPIEFTVVVVGTAVSYLGDFARTKRIAIVENIPTGLPSPRLPIFSLVPEMVLDCFLVTVVSYSVTISMATLFAQKARYKVKPNQELFAMSLSNLSGSFFSCMPVCASLARTYVQFVAGGKTQITSLVAASFILVVLLFMGPLFEPLPTCILASVIVVALKGLLQQMRNIPLLFKLNGWDSVIWMFTFFPTVFVSIDVGLLAGIGVSIGVLFVRGHRPQTCILAPVPGTELYLDVERNSGLVEIAGIKIFRYSGSLNFALRSHFKRLVYEAAMFKPSKILRYIMNPFTEDDHDHIVHEMVTLKCLIVDFSGLTYIDPCCVELLESLIVEYAECSVYTYITGSSCSIFETFRNFERHSKRKLPFIKFVTVHDAVLYAQKNCLFDRPHALVMKEMKIRN